MKQTALTSRDFSPAQTYALQGIADARVFSTIAPGQAEAAEQLILLERETVEPTFGFTFDGHVRVDVETGTGTGAPALAEAIVDEHGHLLRLEIPGAHPGEATTVAGPGDDRFHEIAGRLLAAMLSLPVSR